MARFLGRMALFLSGGHSLRPAIQRWRGVKLGHNVWISQFVYLDELRREAISMADNCTLGLRTTIFTHFYWRPRRAQNGSEEVIIGKDTFIGQHCVILPGVKVGDWRCVCLASWSRGWLDFRSASAMTEHLESGSQRCHSKPKSSLTCEIPSENHAPSADEV